MQSPSHRACMHSMAAHTSQLVKLRKIEHCCYSSTPHKSSTLSNQSCTRKAACLWQDHLTGKQYMGWKAIRDKLTEMQEKQASQRLPPPPGRPEEARSAPREPLRDRCHCLLLHCICIAHADTACTACCRCIATACLPLHAVVPHCHRMLLLHAGTASAYGVLPLHCKCKVVALHCHHQISGSKGVLPRLAC